MEGLGSRVRRRQLDCIVSPKDGHPFQKQKNAKFQELVLCPRNDRGEAALRDADDGEGLALLHERPVSAAAEVKATATSTGNRNKFCVPSQAQLSVGILLRKKHMRRIARKARREIEAGRGAPPRGKMINTLVVTKLWVNGRGEDRDE